MARVIKPTNDAGYMVANRIEPVLASPGASIYGLLQLLAAHIRTRCAGAVAELLANRPRNVIPAPFWTFRLFCLIP